MRKDFGKKPMIFPQPVLMVATYDENGVPDIMNAAWGGVGDDTQVFLCLSPFHKTVKNLLKTKAFTVSMATEDYMEACDYLGIVSANDVPDKVAKSGLHVRKSDKVNAPIIEELPVCLECELISYDEEHCHLFGEIINASADESILTKDRIDPAKAKFLTFDISNSNYHKVGEVAARAFSCGKKIKEEK